MSDLIFDQRKINKVNKKSIKEIVIFKWSIRIDSCNILSYDFRRYRNRSAAKDFIIFKYCDCYSVSQMGWRIVNGMSLQSKAYPQTKGYLSDYWTGSVERALYRFRMDHSPWRRCHGGSFSILISRNFPRDKHHGTAKLATSPSIVQVSKVRTSHLVDAFYQYDLVRRKQTVLKLKWITE